MKLEAFCCLIVAILFCVLVAVNSYLVYRLYIKTKELEETRSKLNEFLSYPAQYVETYRGWIIIKVKNSFHPPAMHHEWIYIAYKEEQVILGVDLPDLIADIDEAEK